VGSIYSPQLKKGHWESFHRTSPMGHQTSPVKFSGSWSGSDLSGPLDKSGEKPLEAGRGALKAGPQTGHVRLTRQVRWMALEAGADPLEVGHRPDKSSGGTRLVRYPSLETGKPTPVSGGFTRQVR
jgi:hypothetical protein